jgi:hypothetical protein
LHTASGRTVMGHAAAKNGGLEFPRFGGHGVVR